MKSIRIIGVLFFSSALFAQNGVPAGTIPPLRLNSSLDAAKSKLGQVITARVMQDVPLPAGTQIRAGSNLLGHIAGDIAYRGGSPVMHGSQVVSEASADGVLAHVVSQAGGGCRDEFENNNALQALWVFSSNACGIYGYPNVTVAHAGRTRPVGQITFASKEGDLHIGSGSGLLLRVVGSKRRLG